MPLVLHCMICCKPLPPDRTKRAKTCSAECQEIMRNAKRAERAGIKCRLCGRRFARPKQSNGLERPVLVSTDNSTDGRKQEAGEVNR